MFLYRGTFIPQTYLTSSNLISTDLISSKYSGCEVTRIAMAVTNQNAVGPAAHVNADSESSDNQFLF